MIIVETEDISSSDHEDNNEDNNEGSSDNDKDHDHQLGNWEPEEDVLPELTTSYEC